MTLETAGACLLFGVIGVVLLVAFVVLIIMLNKSNGTINAEGKNDDACASPITTFDEKNDDACASPITNADENTLMKIAIGEDTLPNIWEDMSRRAIACEMITDQKKLAELVLKYELPDDVDILKIIDKITDEEILLKLCLKRRGEDGIAVRKHVIERIDDQKFLQIVSNVETNEDILSILAIKIEDESFRVSVLKKLKRYSKMRKIRDQE